MADPIIRASIKATCQHNLLILEPYAQSSTTLRITYELISSKVGTDGTAVKSQTGWLTLTEDEPQLLSSLEYDLQAGDQYTITLVLYNGSHVVTSNALNYPQDLHS